MKDFDLFEAVRLRQEGGLGQYLAELVRKSGFCRRHDTEYAYWLAVEHAKIGWTAMGYMPLRPELVRAKARLLDVACVVNTFIDGYGECLPSSIPDEGGWPTQLDLAAFVYYHTTLPSIRILAA